VSVSRLGVEGNRDSFSPSISADGRFVVFLSSADNLVDEDTNGYRDVFIFDREAGDVMRISVGYNGAEANGDSSDAHISNDGRFVAFVSEATNLVKDDDNGFADVFLYERTQGTIRLVSKTQDGVQGDNRSLQPSISAEGRFIAFVSLSETLGADDENDASDIFIYDATDDSLDLVSVASDDRQAQDTSKYPSISSDGRYVVYQSKASNLAAGDHNNMYDIFVRDRQEGTTELISRGLQGNSGNMESQRPSISDDGRFIAFESWASDLIDGDANYQSDIFVFDRSVGEMELISVSSQGSQADHVNGGAVISGDGRYVAFSSMAGNLVPNDANRSFDVYVRDRESAQTHLVSMNLNGSAGNGTSISPALTAAGSNIVFDSLATDLVADDGNEHIDVFVFYAPAVAESVQHNIFLPIVAKP
jgi:Tol biopolymer transport system component